MARVLRQQVTDLDPAMAVYNVQTMREYLDKRCCYRGCAELCSAVCGLTGLILWRDRPLWSDELHGRRANKGNRHPLAIGAAPGDVVRMIARQRMGVALAGMGFGLALSLMAEPGARAVSVWESVRGTW